MNRSIKKTKKTAPAWTEYIFREVSQENTHKKNQQTNLIHHSSTLAQHTALIYSGMHFPKHSAPHSHLPYHYYHHWFFLLCYGTISIPYICNIAAGAVGQNKSLGTSNTIVYLLILGGGGLFIKSPADFQMFVQFVLLVLSHYTKVPHTSRNKHMRKRNRKVEICVHAWMRGWINKSVAWYIVINWILIYILYNLGFIFTSALNALTWKETMLKKINICCIK